MKIYSSIAVLASSALILSGCAATTESLTPVVITPSVSASADASAGSVLEAVNLEQAVADESREKRQKPFERALEMSPVRDLADFAGTLVSVQAARAAFTQDNPTVGGPVDVAVITRHEGFQWLRHK
jgi:hypothetical protein